MCLVIAVFCAILAVNLLIAGHITAAIVSGAFALFFGALMTRNILKTKKEREHKK